MSSLRVAVLDDYQRVASGLADWSSLGPAATVDFFSDHIFDEDQLAERLAPYDAIALMRERTPFPRSLIERLDRLRLLVTTGSRNRSVDLSACTERGITVTTTSSGGKTEELAWALILGVVRSIVPEGLALREGRWQTTLGMGLRGRTLGLLGLGRLGEKTARIGHAFGMKTIAWSHNLTAQRAAECDTERVERFELFERADVISIHLVLGERTLGLVGAPELSRMKPTAYLVNTSRGPIVDTTALIAALEKGTIAGAALDVFEHEPLDPGDPLMHAPNLLLSPHIGYVTREAYAMYFPQIVKNIIAWRDGAAINILTTQ